MECRSMLWPVTDKIIRVNCKAVFLCYQKASQSARVIYGVVSNEGQAKEMIAQGRGGKLVAACSNAAYLPAGLSFLVAPSWLTLSRL